MKTYLLSLSLVLFVFLIGCQQPQHTFSDAEKDIVKKEVKEQFNLLVASINKIDAEAWSKFYSKEEFVSAIVSTDYYAKRDAWVETITKYFTMRNSQKVEPVEVRVTALAVNLALLTSEEKSEMQMKDGSLSKSKHVFTMLWKKEKEGWKIQHSHESWVDEPAK